MTPLTGNNWTVPFDRADKPVPAGQRPPDVGWQSATGGTLRVRDPAARWPLLRTPGRPQGTSRGDHQRGSGSAVLRGGACGRPSDPLGDAQAEIVGVVGDIRRAALTDTPRADMYFPMEHAPSGSATLFIRTTTDPTSIVPSLRTTLRSIEPAITLRSIRTMEEVTRESVQVTELALWLLGLFATTAVVLAAIGITG